VRATVDAFHQISAIWTLLPPLGVSEFPIFLRHEIFDFLAISLADTKMFNSTLFTFCAGSSVTFSALDEFSFLAVDPCLLEIVAASFVRTVDRISVPKLLSYCDITYKNVFVQMALYRFNIDRATALRGP